MLNSLKTTLSDALPAPATTFKWQVHAVAELPHFYNLLNYTDE